LKLETSQVSSYKLENAIITSDDMKV